MKPILVICGPTGVGKTAAGIRHAETVGGEIVSADSGQVYRGMDIGTAKPSVEDQRRVRFHLIDLLDPDERFSAAAFASRAREAIVEIQSRGRVPVIVGGTGLYLKALQEGLFEGPSADPAIRKGLEERMGREGVEVLHRELASIDPVAAKAIPAGNRQRLVRALEVYRITGRPISEGWKEHRQQGNGRSLLFRKVALSLPRDELARRLENRVDLMLGSGLVEEVRGLLKKWGREAPGLKIIGYKEIVQFLEKEIPLSEAITLIKRHTRQYAKRQGTWFKKDKDIQWVTEITI